jgi:hypothetical protein
MEITLPELRSGDVLYLRVELLHSDPNVVALRPAGFRLYDVENVPESEPPRIALTFQKIIE